MEMLGKPAAVVIADGFQHDARSAASSRGTPEFRYVSSERIPGTIEVALGLVEAAIDDKVIDNIVGALTRPLTSQEESPRKEVELLPRLVFKGDLDEVNQFFYKKGWTDGLPIKPPTEQAVAEMLAGTDLAPDDVVGELVPRLGKATVEKIAINAAMAGALPTHMPILIAGVKALVDPRCSLGLMGVSTGSWAPFWIVSGPVRKDVAVYGGIGALSPGHIANATIGRAMALIIKNVGGARQGIEDMGVQGNPMKYSMVVGENEEESPWEPLHVERGLSKEDSAVTLFWPNCYVQVLAYGPQPTDILSTVIYNIPPAAGGILCVLLNPQFGRYLADGGWSKKDIQRFVQEYARAPRERHWQRYAGTMPKELLSVSDTDTMPLILSRSPGQQKVIVVISGRHSSYVGLAIGSKRPEETFVTKKVDLPANWANLVNKYRDLEPTYVRY